jgi:hypothetical protein
MNVIGAMLSATDDICSKDVVGGKCFGEEGIDLQPEKVFTTLHFLHNLLMGSKKLKCLSLASLSCML